MMRPPWDCAQPDEWLPRSLRLCWGGDSSDGGGFGTGGGDWGSAGSGGFGGGGFDAGGGIGGWGGDSFGGPTGGGDWGSAGVSDLSGFNAAGDYASALANSPGGFYDTGGPGIAYGALGAEFGGTFGLSGVSGQPGDPLGAFGAELDAGGGGLSGIGRAIESWGRDTPATQAGYVGSYADLSGGFGGVGSSPGYGGGGGGGYGRGSSDDYGGGYGGGYAGGGRGSSAFGNFGNVGTLGASNAVSAGRGEAGFADTVGGGRSAGPASGGRSDAPTRGEAEVPSVSEADQAAPDADTSAPEAEAPSFGTPTTSAPETEAAPSLSDAAPAGMIGGSRDAAPASQGQGELSQDETSAPAFGPQSLSYDYQGSPYADMGPQTAPSGYDYQGSPYADMGPPSQQAAPNFDQVFADFAPQSGWSPAEQTAGRAGLAEPTDWAASPYAPSTDVSAGRDFNEVFGAFAPSQVSQEGLQALSALTQTALEPAPADYQGAPYADMGRGPQQAAPDFDQAFGDFQTPTGMDLAGDLATQEGDINPSSSFAMGWAPANAYEGRGEDYASGRAAQDYVTNLVSAAPMFAASPAMLSTISAITGISVPSLLGGTAITGGVLGGLNVPTTTPQAPSREQVTEVDIVPASEAPPPAPQDQPTPTPQETPPPAPQEAQPAPQEAQPAPPQEAQPAPQEAQPAPPQEAPPPPPQEALPPQETPPPSLPPMPGLYDMAPVPQSALPFAPNAPPNAPPPAGPADDHEETADPHINTPAQGRSLGAPTTGRQNTPAVSRFVIQEQQGSTRNRPVSEALHGILERAAEQAGVTVRVGSGGQIATRAQRDHGRQGGWTGSIRHNHGDAADIRLEANGRLLNYNNPQDRVVMENFVREAARLGATGMGAGDRYMGPNTIHVGFGNPAFWRADSPGSRALQQAWNEGRHGPRDRPPADIPVRMAQPIVPLPRRRPEDQPDVAPAPPAAALPPQQPPPAPRPPADIPIDIPVQTVPPRAGRADPAMLDRAISGITTQALRGIGPQTTKEQAIAKGAAARAAMIQAGIPASMANPALLDLANKTAAAMGYARGDYMGAVGSAIDKGIAEAMRGYAPAASGPVQGPPSPADLVAPGKRSEAPFGKQFAGLSRSIAEPAPEDYGREGDIGAASPYFGGTTPTVPQLSPMIAPPAPSAPRGPVPGPSYTPTTPGIFSPFRGNEAALPEAPAARQQASLLDILQNFNPISTAEARGGRSQAGRLAAPQADPGTIQGRLSSARAGIIDELQTNQGLRNTLDLIVTGEVGSQGKAAVLGFLETAMNKVAAEASRDGRAPTGRDLLNYLNNRSYFPDTWGKIESGRIKGGALTNDLIGEVGAGSNITKGSTGNSSASSPGSRFGGNPTNVTIGKEHYGVENYGHHVGWYNALGAPDQDMPAVGAMPPAMPAPNPLRGLAKGGRVDDDEPVVVGEQGPEVFVPDRPGTVVPHMPQPARRPAGNIDRWPRLPAPDYPGRYGGVEREMMRQTRAAQDVVPSLMDMIDSGRLRLNAANWDRMINDPALIALGRSRTEDLTSDFIPIPGPAMAPPDPANPMAQALGYDSIRRPLRIGRQSYSR